MTFASHLPKFRKSLSAEACTPMFTSWLRVETGAMHIQALDIKIVIYDYFVCHWHVEVPFIRQTVMSGLTVQAELENTKIHN